MKDRGQSGKTQASPVQLCVSNSTEPLVFESVFMAHHAYVCRSLSYLGVTSGYVDDLAQEVFLVLHRRLSEYDNSRDLRSWLFGIARRVAHTHRRGAARAQRKLSVVPPPQPGPRPDELLAQKEEIAMVDTFIAGLPDKLREVFILSEIEGHPAPEIASTLDLKVNTVYSRVRLARERFARELTRYRVREERRHGRS